MLYKTLQSATYIFYQSRPCTTFLKFTRHNTVAFVEDYETSAKSFLKIQNTLTQYGIGELRFMQLSLKVARESMKGPNINNAKRLDGLVRRHGCGCLTDVQECSK